MNIYSKLKRINQVDSGGSKTKIIRRRHDRTAVSGFVGDIATGNFIFSGKVEDISSGGLRISHLPANFIMANSSYRTLISGDGKHYKFLVRPCWAKKDSSSGNVEVGFKILDASWEWEEFVLNANVDRTLSQSKEYLA